VSFVVGGLFEELLYNGTYDKFYEEIVEIYENTKQVILWFGQLMPLELYERHISLLSFIFKITSSYILPAKYIFSQNCY